MNLKEQFKTIVKDSRKKCEQEKREEEKTLIRSDEDWKVINEYLENQLKDYLKECTTANRFIAKGLDKFMEIGTNWNIIRYPRNSEHGYIYLKDGTRLEITYKDMQRFCKEYKIKLRYTRGVNYDERLFSKKYSEYGMTKSYLVKVS